MVTGKLVVSAHHWLSPVKSSYLCSPSHVLLMCFLVYRVLVIHYTVSIRQVTLSTSAHLRWNEDTRSRAAGEKEPSPLLSPPLPPLPSLAVLEYRGPIYCNGPRCGYRQTERETNQCHVNQYTVTLKCAQSERVREWEKRKSLMEFFYSTGMSPEGLTVNSTLTAYWCVLTVSVTVYLFFFFFFSRPYSTVCQWVCECVCSFHSLDTWLIPTVYCVFYDSVDSVYTQTEWRRQWESLKGKVWRTLSDRFIAATAYA